MSDKATAQHDTANTSIDGGCACGAVTYSSKAPVKRLDCCYCDTCQRVSGAPFVAWAGISPGALVWRGPITRVRVSDLAVRTFCSQCGGTLTMQYECYPETIHVAAGTFIRSAWDTPKPSMHIFLKYLPSWYSVPDDGAPRYDEFDEGTAEDIRRHQEHQLSQQS